MRSTLNLGLENKLLVDLLLSQEKVLLSSLSSGQRHLHEHWKNRLAAPNVWKSMLSKKYRSGQSPITKEISSKNDKDFGKAVDWYMSWEVEDYRRERSYIPKTTVDKPARLVKIGAGNGLGLGYFSSALSAPLNVEIYDWLSTALVYANKALRNTILEFGLNEEDVFRIGEATQISESLDDTVRILEMIRVDEHMEDGDASFFFQNSARILLDPMNRIVVAGARKCEFNSQSEVETCHHREDKFVQQKIEEGLNRKVRIYRQWKYRDVEKEFTFQTIRLKS